MNKVFRVIPKRIKRANGTMLTPEMGITVTTLHIRLTCFTMVQKRL